MAWRHRYSAGTVAGTAGFIFKNNQVIVGIFSSLLVATPRKFKVRILDRVKRVPAYCLTRASQLSAGPSILKYLAVLNLVGT
eukprot:SAG31_NODE_21_length_34109_cov_60.598824_19_plen_82_part_00